MDVDELLKFQPAKPLTDNARKQAPSSSAESQPAKKKFKGLTSADLDRLTDKQKLDVLKMLENEPEGEVFNESQLKKMLNQFEKKVSKNQEMRIKFCENPEKFMDSEIELNAAIQELQVVSTRPDLYPYLFDSNCLSQLLALLGHENIDICAATVALLQELTDLDEEQAMANMKQLVNHLCDNQIVSLLVSNLERFDEKNKDESEAIHHCLGIVENILEVRPELSADCSKQGLLQWLLKRIKVKGFDGNKLYAAELLSILVQNEDENRKLLGELGGIDILLQQIAYYKKHDPKSAEEFEFMENVFDILCSCLMLPANRGKFLEGEGLQLMRLIIREQKSARNSALKVLSYAMNNAEGKANCQAFVEILGLAVLFPLFMKPEKTKDKKKKSKESYNNNEEHIVSIIASLLKNCDETNKQRVIFKFMENDHEKVDRLFELYFKYVEQVEKTELEPSDDEDEDELDIELENYMRKLENGLFALQSIVYIIMDISVNSDQIRTRINKHLNMRSVKKASLVEVMQEYADNLGEEGKSEATNEELKNIKELIEKFNSA